MQKQKVRNGLFLRATAKAAKKVSEISANFPCLYWSYQPKMPKAVKQMRKF
ncbi:MAG: cyclic lactone autoinducer peptide [Oscillospiraceae bacterium]|nr:cyclic lactone autoinducer peptide [Oscillospiraceae bacterium]